MQEQRQHCIAGGYGVTEFSRANAGICSSDAALQRTWQRAVPPDSTLRHSREPPHPKERSNAG